jgi:hypothetical protein
MLENVFPMRTNFPLEFKGKILEYLLTWKRAIVILECGIMTSFMDQDIGLVLQFDNIHLELG